MSSHKPTKTNTFNQNKQLAADLLVSDQNHTPVLLKEVQEIFVSQIGGNYLDLTAGYGGHAEAVLSNFSKGAATLVDRDPQAVAYLRQKFPQATVHQSDFAAFVQQATQEGQQYNAILADLGVSSVQIDTPARGFSMRFDGPLDMRMDQQGNLTADEVVNRYSQQQLADILYVYGEEWRAKRFAAAIVAARPLSSTKDLADLIARQGGHKKNKRHPATKTFQALRIYVNRELEQLEILLEFGPRLLAPGGILGIISFHSLEDRAVKQTFADLGQDTLDSEYRLLTKKPIVPSTTELVSNPRARSAKLRALQRK